MDKFNPKALAATKAVQRPEQEEYAYLITEETKDDENAPAVFQFFCNPTSIQRSFESVWTESGAVGVAKQTLQWYHGSNTNVVFSDLLLNSHEHSRSIYPLLDALVKLKDKAPGKREPHTLYFRWGGRLIGPCVMKDCEVNEEAWINGFCTQARVTLTLIEIPRPDEQRQLLPSTLSNSPVGKLPVTLSTGATKEGSKKANDWIKANVNKIKGNLGKAAKAGEKAYALATDSQTGLVKMKSGDNSAIVGIWDGSELFTLDQVQKIAKDKLRKVLENNRTLNTVFGKTIEELLPAASNK